MSRCRTGSFRRLAMNVKGKIFRWEIGGGAITGLVYGVLAVKESDEGGRGIRRR